MTAARFKGVMAAWKSKFEHLGLSFFFSKLISGAVLYVVQEYFGSALSFYLNNKVGNNSKPFVPDKQRLFGSGSFLYLLKLCILPCTVIFSQNQERNPPTAKI